MNPEEKDIRRFETRVRQMILSFKEQKHQVEVLLGKMGEKDAEIADLKQQIETLRKEHEALLMAKMINLDDDKAADAKDKITRLIKEVNRCIDLVKERS